MKFLKILIPISILSLVFIFDYYNKYYKPNTSFDDESIFLYVIKDDSLAFRDSISKYIKSEKPFYKVDYDYTLEIAKKSLDSGCSSISLISAIGANSSSPSFYLKTKGDIEEEIKRLPFRKINIFQPGHLAGRIDWQRKKNDPRIDVFAFEAASLFFDPFMISGLKKFRSINADKLAKFVVNKSKDKKYGINYMSYNDFTSKK